MASWIFEQSTGRLFDPSGELIGEGYAGGDEGKHPEGINNPEMENLKDIGPIVHGHYTADYVIDHSKLGNYAIHLTPDNATRIIILSYGRDPESFFNHGDLVSAPGKREASDGCIVDDLAMRIKLWTSPVHDLTVVAVYDPFGKSGFGIGGNR